MQKRLEPGTSAYIIESNRNITQVMIIAVRGEFCILRFPSGGAIQLKKHRIFLTRDDAEAQLPNKKIERGSFSRSPYYYDH